MKLKYDFVTNSSSSSFIIDKKHLTKKQIMMIHDHIDIGKILDRTNKRMYYGHYPVAMADEWRIEEYKYQLKFDTVMDNFDMWWFLSEIGVKDEHIPPREN